MGDEHQQVSLGSSRTSSFRAALASLVPGTTLASCTDEHQQAPVIRGSSFKAGSMIASSGSASHSPNTSKPTSGRHPVIPVIPDMTDDSQLLSTRGSSSKGGSVLPNSMLGDDQRAPSNNPSRSSSSRIGTMRGSGWAGDEQHVLISSKASSFRAVPLTPGAASSVASSAGATARNSRRIVTMPDITNDSQLMSTRGSSSKF